MNDTLPPPSDLPPDLERRREQLLEQLRMLEIGFQLDRKPILRQLVEIENLRPPRRFFP